MFSHIFFDADPPWLEMTIITLPDRVNLMERVQKDMMERLECVETLLATPYNNLYKFQSEVGSNVTGYFGWYQPWMIQPSCSTTVQSTSAPVQLAVIPVCSSATSARSLATLAQNDSAEEQTPTPLPSTAGANVLSSSAINKLLVVNAQDVINKYLKLRGECKARGDEAVHAWWESRIPCIACQESC